MTKRDYIVKQYVDGKWVVISEHDLKADAVVACDKLRKETDNDNYYVFWRVTNVREGIE